MPAVGDQLSMLWEKTDPLVALQRRFQFESVHGAGRWLADLLANSYGISVEGVDRIIISAGNLLAWLHTPDGSIIAKCCAYPGIHQRRLAIAEMLAWLPEKGIPVSAPVPARDGALQIERDHLSVGLQRVVRGDLLDLADPAQVRTAGEMLAELHRALADYPAAIDLAPTGRPDAKTEFGDWSQSADIVDADLRLLIERRLDDLDKIDTQLVHFDYRSANVLTSAGKIIAILDFEEVQPLPRVADAAHAAVLLGCRYHDWAPMPVDVETAFLGAYERGAGLDRNERNWLRLFQLRYAIDAGPRWQGMVDRLIVG
jgi:homoserine kinase type II